MQTIKNIFTKDYWMSSLNKFKDVRSIAFMAILMGLIALVGGLCSYNPIKILDREFSLTFIFWPVLAILFGPIPTMIIAGVVDILIYFLFPNGYPFYIGYTLTQMLLAFLNGLFFYRTNVTVGKISLCKFIINFGIHVGIESLFMKDIMKFTDSAFQTYIVGGIIKNAIFWPIECIVMFIVLSALLPVFRSFSLIDEEIEIRVKLF